MTSKHINMLLIFLICLFTLPILAQEKIENLKEGKITINNRVYSISKYTRYQDTFASIQYNIEFIQEQEGRKTRVISLPHLASEKTIYKVVVETLGIPRIKELSLTDKKSFGLNAYKDYTGKIKAIKYDIPIDQHITMEELDRITSAIERDVFYKTPENITPDLKIYPAGAGINYHTILYFHSRGFEIK